MLKTKILILHYRKHIVQWSKRASQTQTPNEAKWREMMVKIEEKFGQRIGNVLRARFEWGQIG